MRALRWLSLIVPLGVGAAMMAHDIAAPWTGSFDANGALFSTAARNYLRHGLIATRGGQVCNAGELRPGDFRFYSHHPPGISLAIVGSFAAFGVHEWSARLVPLLFTLGAAWCLHRVASRMAGPLAGFFAAGIFVLQPMVTLYGRMPDHEAPAAFFTLLLAVFYLEWREDGRRGWLAAMAATTFVGVWFAWIVAVVPWALLAHGWLSGRRDAKRLLIPAAAGVVGFLSVLGHIALVEGGVGGLGQALVHRLGWEAGDRAAEGQFGFGEFVAKQGVYFWRGFSLIACGVALAWLLGLGRPRKAEALLVAALAAVGLFNVLAFRQGAYVHIYYQFYLAIPLALMAGQALAATARHGKWLLGPLAAIGLVAGVGAESWYKLLPARLGAAFDSFYPNQMWLARYLAEHTQPRDAILLRCNWASSFRQVTYYADRNFHVVPSMEEAEKLWAGGGFTKAFGVSWVSGWNVHPLFGARPGGTLGPSPPPGL